MQQIQVEIHTGESKQSRLFPNNIKGNKEAEKYIQQTADAYLSQPYYKGSKELLAAKKSDNSTKEKKVLRMQHSYRIDNNLQSPPPLKVIITHS